MTEQDGQVFVTSNAVESVVSLHAIRNPAEPAQPAASLPSAIVKVQPVSATCTTASQLEDVATTRFDESSAPEQWEQVSSYLAVPR